MLTDVTTDGFLDPRQHVRLRRLACQAVLALLFSIHCNALCTPDARMTGAQCNLKHCVIPWDAHLKGEEVAVCDEAERGAAIQEGASGSYGQGKTVRLHAHQWNHPVPAATTVPVSSAVQQGAPGVYGQAKAACLHVHKGTIQSCMQGSHSLYHAFTPAEKRVGNMHLAR